MINILMLGGTWDEKGGKKSSIIDIMHKALEKHRCVSRIRTFNGGAYTDIADILDSPLFLDNEAIFWFPNISNGQSKTVGAIKKDFPKVILVTSKRNIDDKYSIQETVAHGLSIKSNLILEISNCENKYCGRILDPLCNSWIKSTDDFAAIADALAVRSDYLKKITRKPTIHSPEMKESIPDTQENRLFFNIIKKSAEKFHELINPAENIKRFLGNASFRCMRGFPSIKDNNGNIFVSRRNIDKRYIGPDEFVQAGYNHEKDIVWYRGDNKPSVDTVVQVELYRRLPRISYMIHAHVYVKDAPFTM